MAHSNQVREFLLTDRGIDLLDVYVGPEGVLTGSARLAQEAREKAASMERRQEIETMKQDVERFREAAEKQIASLRAEVESKEGDLKQFLLMEELREENLDRDRERMVQLRKADSAASTRARDSRKGGKK
jgi:circadian clock protein KaiC